MYKINSYAKINLSLDVLNKRDDGYHDIDTIMQLIDLKDIVSVDVRNDDILKISCNNKSVPTDERNLIYKAWELLKAYSKEDCLGLNVNIEKNIPVAAGLAGGSSNAAYFMKALNDIWKLKLEKEELMDIGKNIGADIPYFFVEGTARAEGIGNIFTKMKDFKDIYVLIVNSGCEVSTPYVYNNLKLSKNSRIENLMEILNSDNPLNREYYYNIMTDVSGEICPEVYTIIDRLYALDASVALMSGSGSTVFGLYDSSEKIDRAYNELKNKYKYVIKTKTK